MEDAGPEAVDKHAAKSHSDKAEVATIDIHSVRAILSALPVSIMLVREWMIAILVKMHWFLHIHVLRSAAKD